MKKSRLVIIMIVALTCHNSCRISYSLSGANTGQLKTVSVQYFPNRASIVKPMLSQYFTDELRDLCQRQTSLTLVNTLGEANFEGEITAYNTRPVAISGAETASLNRFSISIKVKYTNSLDPDLNFDETFTHYEDYDSSKSLDQVEGELTELIVERIVEDIFNKAFVNW
jgi:hypothetical protein